MIEKTLVNFGGRAGGAEYVGVVGQIKVGWTGRHGFSSRQGVKR